MLVALSLRLLKDTNRRIFLYDTFAGMVEPEKRDSQILDGKPAFNEFKSNLREDHNEWNYASIEEVKTNTVSTGYDPEKIILVKGRVEDTIPKTVPSRISLLRLDTDFYSSTKWELIHLYPLVSLGGVVLIDDYGHWAGCKEAVDEYIEQNNVRILLNRTDYTGRIGVKC